MIDLTAYASEKLLNLCATICVLKKKKLTRMCTYRCPKKRENVYLLIMSAVEMAHAMPLFFYKPNYMPYTSMVEHASCLPGPR
jgi:hypothetical protein